ncbi:MAG: hypothetical protein ACXACU_16315 [Candidatus Hodarchaeales archaeon]|jgi:hypothetical protein
MFRKKLKELLKMMGVTDVDEELLDSLARQLFQFLEFDDSLAGGITFKTGSILTTVQVQNYQEARDRLYHSYQGGEAPEKMNLRLQLSSLCLYLTEDQQCQVTGELCNFIPNSKWWECEIVQASCQNGNEEWK